MPSSAPFLARLKPYAPREGHVLKTLFAFGHLFEEGGQAIPVTAEQAKMLREYRAVAGDPRSPLALDVVDTAAALPPVVKSASPVGAITADDWKDGDGAPEDEDDVDMAPEASQAPASSPPPSTPKVSPKAGAAATQAQPTQPRGKAAKR